MDDPNVFGGLLNVRVYHVLATLLTPARRQRQHCRSCNEGTAFPLTMCDFSLQLVNDSAIYHDAVGEWLGGRRGGWQFR